MESFQTKILLLEKKSKEILSSLSTLDDLQTFDVEFLGKKGQLSFLIQELKGLSDIQKKEMGPLLQKLRMDLFENFETKKKNIEFQKQEEKLQSDWIDVTRSFPFPNGTIHPIAQLQKKVEDIFLSLGFEIADGPEVETEWYNFDALNIPSDHPARDMHDTFWIQTGSNTSQKNSVLRTHTSSVQIRKMLDKGAPIRMIVPGRVYRNEATDSTHDATFYQVEGLLVEKGISLAHLKGVIETMLAEIFEKKIKIRFRPGYFPFVEPGLEVDIWFEYINKQGQNIGMWLEFMGAGMVHPQVLRNCNINPDEYTGFAFGFGLTRLAMLQYGIDDIRLLFSQKKEFLSQF